MPMFLNGNKDHPRNVKAMVRPGRYWNGPNGEHNGPGDIIHVSRYEVEYARGILVEYGSPECDEILQRGSNRQEVGAPQQREAVAAAPAEDAAPTEEAPKRRRGRPRKKATED